uniref:protein-glutamine gamma-glutamyltransferase n=1 Tax=Leptobrachium leishanense TaxID=445787 RepID=A0A8C5R7A8_9ANUR
MSSLRFVRVNLRQEANEKAHHTNDYYSSKLVTRRGQPVAIDVTLSRPLQTGDRLTLISEIGSSPSESSNTRAVMPVSRSGSKTKWSATSTSTGSTMAINMNSPSTAIVGEYRLILQIVSGGRTSTHNLGSFFLLFNAWGTEDEVFLNNEAERLEYVQNETGLIFYGSANSQGSRQWDFGQKEEGILEIAFTILNKSLEARKNPLVDLSKRNSALYIARVFSAMVNSNDDNGILRGNWSGNYSNGTSPTAWNGSVPILKKWQASGPVGFGQCWVFAGVLCTVHRALGIPCRVITNYESAHDTTNDLYVDYYVDEDGNPLSESADSVWNFHVWNEIWCIRLDLGPTYNGWQVVDATPQEPSEGVFCLGPTAVTAVKEGEVDLPFDTTFVAGEVNADRVTWVRRRDGSRTKISTDPKSVGKFISTKAVGAFRREDVTDNYKYPEGSAKNQEVFEKARAKLTKPHTMAMGRSAMARFASPAAREATAPEPNLTGSFVLGEQREVGEDLSLIMKLKNTANDSQEVKVKLTVNAILYTKAPMAEIMKQDLTISLGPNQEKDIPLTVTYADYRDAITADNMIQWIAVCDDKNGGHLLFDAVVTMKNPPISIRISGYPTVNKPITVDVIFSNPLGEDVSRSTLTVEGSGLLHAPLPITIPPLKPNQRSKTQFDIIPYRPGQRCLYVDFSSKQFSDVKGHTTVNVAPA